jgi:pimeloyl-ACP methyl ester carboxylesterase
VAARLAARWFLTPPHRPRPAAELALLEAARARPVRLPDGTRIETWRWGRGPVALLVHGWGGRGGQLSALVEPLVARGFAVVAFDAPGHGTSPARPVTVPEMAAALRAVAADHGPISALIAHSAGAVVATRAFEEGLAASVAVFVAPAASLHAATARFTAAVGLAPAASAALRARLEQRAGLPWSAFDVPALAPARRVPLLVVHDRADREVPCADAHAIAAAWPGARLVLTEGLGHWRLLRDPEVIAAALDFVAATVPGRPAGPAWPANQPPVPRVEAPVDVWAEAGLTRHVDRLLARKDAA